MAYPIVFKQKLYKVKTGQSDYVLTESEAKALMTKKANQVHFVEVSRSYSSPLNRVTVKPTKVIIFLDIVFFGIVQLLEILIPTQVQLKKRYTLYS